MPENENRQKTHSKVTKNEIKGHSPHFWGKFALKKRSRIFCTGTGRAFFRGPNLGTFGKSGHIGVPKNDTSSADTKNPRPLL